MVAGHLVKVKSRGAIRIGNQRPRFRFSQIIVDAHQPFDAEAGRRVPKHATLVLWVSKKTSLSPRHYSNRLSARSRHAYRNYGASGFGPCNTDFSSHEMGAFSHSDDAQRFRTRLLLRRDPSSVVADCQDELALLFVHGNLDPCRLGMTQNIGEGFLRDAEVSSRLLSTQVRVFY